MGEVGTHHASIPVMTVEHQTAHTMNSRLLPLESNLYRQRILTEVRKLLRNGDAVYTDSVRVTDINLSATPGKLRVIGISESFCIVSPRAFRDASGAEICTSRHAGDI